jgi:hypothetical protein
MPTGSKAVIAIVAAVLSGVGIGQVVPSSDPQSHPQMDWKGPGGCVVRYGNTPCRTVHYHTVSFGSGLGFEGTTRSERTEAVDHDGSECTAVVAARRRYWFFPPKTERKTELVLRKENRTVYIDHERRTFETHVGGANKAWSYWEEDDSLCSHTASRATYLSGRLPDSVIAGVHVVGYRGRDHRGAEYEVYFAPSIGCVQMRFQMVMRGLFGWKTAEYEMVVDSYEIGPPSSSLFAVPTGYRQVASILRP